MDSGTFVRKQSFRESAPKWPKTEHTDKNLAAPRRRYLQENIVHIFAGKAGKYFAGKAGRGSRVLKLNESGFPNFFNKHNDDDERREQACEPPGGTERGWMHVPDSDYHDS